MNPPFNSQLIDHIKHAYNLLKAGGVLVAVMPLGPFHGTSEKYKNFRSWLAETEHYKSTLPARAFQESGTNVNTTLVIIHKPKTLKFSYWAGSFHRNHAE